jgi:hypothetical protein
MIYRHSYRAFVTSDRSDSRGRRQTFRRSVRLGPDPKKWMRADLAGKGAEFVAAINKAKDAETRSDLGFSLTWYAVAQRYYPASSMANEAIERLSKQILSGKVGAS